MTVKSSELVILSMYGRTTSGASVGPRKMSAVTESDSGRLVPRTLCSAPPRILTTQGRILR